MVMIVIICLMRTVLQVLSAIFRRVLKPVHRSQIFQLWPLTHASHVRSFSSHFSFSLSISNSSNFRFQFCIQFALQTAMFEYKIRRDCDSFNFNLRLSKNIQPTFIFLSFRIALKSSFTSNFTTLSFMTVMVFDLVSSKGVECEQALIVFNRIRNWNSNYWHWERMINSKLYLNTPPSRVGRTFVLHPINCFFLVELIVFGRYIGPVAGIKL